MYISKFNNVIEVVKRDNPSTKSTFSIITINGVEHNLSGYYLGHINDHNYHHYYDIPDDKVFTFKKENIIIVQQFPNTDEFKNILIKSFNESKEPTIPEINIETIGDFEMPPITNVKQVIEPNETNWITFCNLEFIVYINRRNLVCFS